MSQQKKSAPTDAELSAMFEGIGGDDETNALTTTSQLTTKDKPTSTNSSNEAEEDDPLAELKTLATAPRTSTSSRPNTPHLASSTATSTRTRSPAGHRVYTPTTGSGRSSEEKAAAERQGVETQKVFQAPQAPASHSQQAEAEGGGGGWWGGFSALASAAVKQGQAAFQEIQQNEEAQRWAEQMRGNVGALRGIGGQLSSKALPTFTNILQTLAPPISQHERLQIHITHDFVHYPSLDPLIYQTFSRVMSQVEGGDLMVIQRGSESSQKRSNPEGYTGGSLGNNNNGWSDGPWWRQNDIERNLGAVRGIIEGSKLARASAEGYGQDFFSSKGGVEEAAKQAAAVLSESNPTRSSDIFLAIQAISHTAEKEMFGAGASVEKKEDDVVVDEEAKPEELVSFAIYLHDPIHSIAFSAVSQSFPQRWSDWLDAKSTASAEDGEKFVPQLPEEILEIIENDGVDPREWVAEWLEETISLAVGVVAQRYVARRMGVGEGGIGRGKRRDMVVESGAGEAARAL